jgi:hypothetical protein
MVLFHTELHVRLITDVADLYEDPAAKHGSQLDIATLRSRVQAEGLPFLTVTLPKLGKALDKALSQGTPFDAEGWETRPNSKIPKFLGFLFEHVFADDGVERTELSFNQYAVGYLRQILYFVYKLEVQFTEEQELETLKSFKDTDSGLPCHIPCDNVIVHARNLITSVFGSFDPLDIVPRHGAGAVATGEKNHEKHRFKRFYSAINDVYPYTEYMVFSLDQLAMEPEYLESMEFHVTGTAKVVLVPKDSRGPRVISCEPLEYQWMQGGLGSAIMRHLEFNGYTSGRVNFRSQKVNRELALQASKGAHWVTLDMKDASDRVSLALVEVLFQDVPQLLKCLKALRTTATQLPSGEIVQLKKFAPMGSSLCFPIESIVFFALGVGVLMDKQMREGRVRPCAAKHAAMQYRNRLLATTRRLRVYGDDIISRLEDYEALLQYFPSVGLRFNPDKCCTHGSFRESCGMDAYKGTCVTPLRMKRVWNISRNNNSETLISTVCLSNNLYMKGYSRTADYIESAINDNSNGIRVPYIAPPMDSRLYKQWSIRLTFPMGEFVTDRFLSDKDDWELAPGFLIFLRFGTHVEETHRFAPFSRHNTDTWQSEVLLLQAQPRHIRVPAADWSMVLRRFSAGSQHGQPGLFALTRRITLKRVWTPTYTLFRV